MGLNERELELVRSTLARAREEHAPGGTIFYERLFARAPELRSMFREDLAGQGMKFMSTLGVIVDALDRPDVLEGEIASLAQGHADIGVEARHFAPMGDALIDTFREVLGEEFTDEAAAAWRAAYAEIAAKMIDRGKMG